MAFEAFTFRSDEVGEDGLFPRPEGLSEGTFDARVSLEVKLTRRSLEETTNVTYSESGGPPREVEFRKGLRTVEEFRRRFRDAKAKYSLTTSGLSRLDVGGGVSLSVGEGLSNFLGFRGLGDEVVGGTVTSDGPPAFTNEGKVLLKTNFASTSLGEGTLSSFYRELHGDVVDVSCRREVTFSGRGGCSAYFVDSYGNEVVPELFVVRVLPWEGRETKGSLPSFEEAFSKAASSPKLRVDLCLRQRMLARLEFASDALLRHSLMRAMATVARESVEERPPDQEEEEEEGEDYSTLEDSIKESLRTETGPLQRRAEAAFAKEARNLLESL